MWFDSMPTPNTRKGVVSRSPDVNRGSAGTKEADMAVKPPVPVT
jgi:hypothetical protein